MHIWTGQKFSDAFCTKIPKLGCGLERIACSSIGGLRNETHFVEKGCKVVNPPTVQGPPMLQLACKFIFGVRIYGSLISSEVLSASLPLSDSFKTPPPAERRYVTNSLELGIFTPRHHHLQTSPTMLLTLTTCVLPNTNIMTDFSKHP